MKFKFAIFFLILSKNIISEDKAKIDLLIEKIDDLIESKKESEKESEKLTQKELCLQKCEDQKRSCRLRVTNHATAHDDCKVEHCSCIHKCGIRCN